MAAGSTEGVVTHAVDLTTILEVATKVDDEDPLDGHIFWQLLMQAGYTRW